VVGLNAFGKPLREAEAGKLRGEIAQILANMLPSGSILCGSKRTMQAMIDSHGTDPARVTWFGALRGLNSWERCTGGLFIGAESLSVGDVEAIARAYMADDPEPFVSMDHPAPKGWGKSGWPYIATRMRRMADGSRQPIEVEVHPDPRVQRVLEQIREAELHQAIDRLRPIWNPRQIVLCNNLVLDVDYSAVYRHRELAAGGNRIEQAFLANGILPLSPKELHRLNPDLFKTEKAAAGALRDHPLNTNIAPIWNAGVFRFRRVGQPGDADSRVVLDMDRHPDPLAAITARFGPLSTLNGVPVAADDDQTPIVNRQRAPQPPRRPPLIPPPLPYMPPWPVMRLPDH
jgi:hypothetical protein